MNSLVWLAVVLFIIWIVARMFMAITSMALHLVWVIAVLFLIFWLFQKFAS